MAAIPGEKREARRKKREERRERREERGERREKRKERGLVMLRLQFVCKATL